MYGPIITRLTELLKRLNPDCIFEFDEARMINVKVDTVTRDKMFIYVEEPRQSWTEIDQYRRTRQRSILTIYFCKFEDMHNDNWAGDSLWNEKANVTIHRQTVRDEIESTIVRPFIAVLGTSELFARYPQAFTSVRTIYPLTRFDANEVSVGLEITLYEEWCFENYLPVIPEPPILEKIQLSLNWIDYLGNAVRNPTYDDYDQFTIFTIPEIEPALAAQMATSGQRFEDWNTDWRGTGESYQPGESISLTKNTILWARFIRII